MAQEGLFLANGFSSRFRQGESIAHTVSFRSVPVAALPPRRWLPWSAPSFFSQIVYDVSGLPAENHLAVFLFFKEFLRYLKGMVLMQRGCFQFLMLLIHMQKEIVLIQLGLIHTQKV